MKVILAVDKNSAIGKNGDMLFSTPEDMQRFKELITGSIVIMGRKTSEPLPNSKPLPNRINIITMSKDLDGTLRVGNEEELLRILKETGPDHKMTEYLISGANIVELLIHLVDESVVTYVDCEFGYDAKIGNLFEDQDFYASEEPDIKSYESLGYRYMVFKRKQEKEYRTFMLRISYGKNYFDFKSKKSVKKPYRVSEVCLRF